jgi:hypothetical protein
MRITQSAFGVKSSWKKFLDSLPMTVKLLYKDEFINKFEDVLEIEKIEFPCAYIKKGDLLEPFVSKEEIQRANSLDDLIDVFYENLINK